ncbi:chemotaxis protein CheW [bacterium]|nr:chemotaxis protein CheW [bacterium]
MSTKQFCTFTLDGHHFGVDVEKVQEVIRYQEMTFIPLANSIITGLINLRGHIVTAMDLRRRLGMNDRGENEKLPTNVVIRSEDSPVSLLVDEIGDIMELEDETFEAPPATLQGSVKELISGAYKLKDKLLLILKVDETLELTGKKEEMEATA